MEITQLFSIIVLIFSVVVHEVSHGYAALYLGDTTAKYAGRLTLNPIKHLDLFGSVIIPLLLIILPGSIIFGWAKPVPYNPYNLINRRWGEVYVALAGPLSNLVIAMIFGTIVKYGALTFPAPFIEISIIIVLINIVLAIFNLIPIPPLDGSKILFGILPQQAQKIRYFLERFGFFIILFFVLFLWDFVTPIISEMFFIFTGLQF